MKINKRLLYIMLPLTLGILTACGDDDDDNDEMMPEVDPPVVVNYTYEVSVTNLTYAQPFSPVFTALHNEGGLWEVGSMSTVALEKLAESGDTSDLAALTNLLANAAGGGIVMPGMSDTVQVTISDTMPNLISVATMLVNTNDAFTGVTSVDVSSLMVGESITMTVGTYDAGTEQNSEAAGTIPGPADGGEGYNAARDDVDFVSMHPGVVSMDDGLAESVLTQAHRFDNPTSRISITRME